MLTACAVVTAVFFINFCGWFFACGCKSLWAGAAEHCNIHNPDGPHCPWCSVPAVMQAGIFRAIVAFQGLVLFVSRGQAWPVRLSLGILAFPAGALIAGSITKLALGYWN